MLETNILKSFSPLIIEWYKHMQRELPWRQTQNPYKIWLSEIILQQTRVNQGLSYYNRFIEQFPNIQTLAEAQEDEILKLWQGLGYYSRARNIHATAKIIMQKHNGVFPTTHKDILALKGIGEYTAAAISSFAYNEAYAVVDGNVYRVLARVFGINTPIDSTGGKKEFASLATELLNKNEPATHNQAIMEFGALQCTPLQPDCENCILKEMCVAYNSNTINKYPLKSLKTKQRKRYFNYLYIEEENYTYINKRGSKDVWQNLYELPLIETEKECSFNELVQHDEFKSLLLNAKNIEFKQDIFKTTHILSHQRIFATFHHIKIDAKAEGLQKFIKINISEIDKYPVSKLIERFFKKE